jgi:Fe2+ transport system protein FeoA
MDLLTGALMTLAEVHLGAAVMIAECRRVDPRVGRRLAELGLRPGAWVRVLMRTPGDGRVIAIDHARIALGRDLLRQVAVQPAGPDER